MKSSLRAFLERLFDYAGMFPPASLSLEAALHNYLEHRRQPGAWMLGRFICGAPTLSRLAAQVEDAETRLPVSLLATGGDGISQFVKALESDLDRIAEHSGYVRVEAVEARLPEELVDSTVDELTAFFRDVASRMEASGAAGVEVFFEAPTVDRVTVWPRTLRALAECRDPQGRARVGFKVRCGGLTASAFPTVEELQQALQWAHRGGVPLKATAGLHHPMRHFDPRLGVYRHGFFNLFGAGILLRAEDLDPETVRRILLEQNPSHFSFEEVGFSWNGICCRSQLIHDIRTRFMTSLGSCSFDEPREDLAALGLLRPSDAPVRP